MAFFAVYNASSINHSNFEQTLGDAGLSFYESYDEARSNQSDNAAACFYIPFERLEDVLSDDNVRLIIVCEPVDRFLADEGAADLQNWRDIADAIVQISVGSFSKVAVCDFNSLKNMPASFATYIKATFQVSLEYDCGDYSIECKGFSHDYSAVMRAIFAGGDIFDQSEELAAVLTFNPAQTIYNPKCKLEQIFSHYIERVEQKSQLLTERERLLEGANAKISDLEKDNQRLQALIQTLKSSSSMSAKRSQIAFEAVKEELSIVYKSRKADHENNQLLLNGLRSEFSDKERQLDDMKARLKNLEKDKLDLQSSFKSMKEAHKAQIDRQSLEYMAVKEELSIVYKSRKADHENNQLLLTGLRSEFSDKERQLDDMKARLKNLEKDKLDLQSSFKSSKEAHKAQIDRKNLEYMAVKEEQSLAYKSQRLMQDKFKESLASSEGQISQSLGEISKLKTKCKQSDDRQVLLKLQVDQLNEELMYYYDLYLTSKDKLQKHNDNYDCRLGGDLIELAFDLSSFRDRVNLG